MQTSIPTGLVVAASLLAACSSSPDPASPDAAAAPSAAAAPRYEPVDALRLRLEEGLQGIDVVVSIDHARLAAAEGVSMPPAVVTLFAAPAAVTRLIQLEPRSGLDLPLKALVFEEGGVPTVAFPTASFLAARHGLTSERALEDYDAAMVSALRFIDLDARARVGAEGVTRDFGIAELASDFDFDESIARLEAAVMSQGDTVWFGSIDYRAEAAARGVSVPPATLLLFGGPKPGGVAMAQFPKLGLDAFCQKLLVLEGEEGEVTVLFNEIAAFAELHYERSAAPHHGIDQRLRQTFEGALRRP